MSDVEKTQQPPVVVRISPTEIEDGWLDQVRRKLEEQGLGPETASRVTDEVQRLSTAVRVDSRKLRAAALIHLLLGALVLVSVVVSGILNTMRHAYAIVYFADGAAAVWGVILMRRGMAQLRLRRRSHSG